MTHWDDPADRADQAWHAAPESEAHYQERVDFFSRVAVDSLLPAVREHARDELKKYQEWLQQLQQRQPHGELPF